MSRVFSPIIPGEDMVSGAQIVDGSLKFNGSNSTALKRTPSSDGNKKTWTWSAWVKKHKDSRSTLFSAGATSSDTGYAAIEIETDEQLRYTGWNTLWKESSAVFRDYNQFYHIVVAFDSTQSTASNRVRLYKNGTEITDLAANNSISQNTDYPINGNVIHYIGGIDGGGGENITFSDYNMTQVYLVDGQALDPSYFGYTDPLTNTWRPKKYSGTFTQSSLNDGTTWSSSLTSSTGSFAGGYAATAAFDGSTGTAAATSTGGGLSVYLTWSPSGFSSADHTLRVYTYSGYKIDVDAVEKNADSPGGGGSAGWVDCGTISGGFSTVKVYGNAAANSGSAIFAIEVDGEVLINGLNNSGVNSFYLPLDGNSPIGQDQSGKGNNWTPVNFGGSNTLEKATGALPILNTDGGGKVARVGVRTDAYASNLVLALPLVGNANDVSSNNRTPSSTTGLSFTNTSIVSNNYGLTGCYVSGAASQKIAFADSDDFNLDGLFTIEFWMYQHTQQDGTILADDGINGQPNIIYTNANKRLQLQVSGLNIESEDQVAANLLGGWHHIAFVRAHTSDTNQIYLFIDGVEKTLRARTNNNGVNWNSVSFFTGAVGRIAAAFQDFRIYKGVAKYTSNFIPASTDPDILPDTPSGVSGSSKLTQITDGAVAFDGSGDYLELADSDDFNFGSGNFTIEFFVNPSSISRQTLFAQINSSGTNASASFYTEINSSAQWRFLVASGSTSYEITAGTAVANKWTHLAYVRSGNTTTLYVDGVSIGTGDVTGVTVNNSSEVVSIGRYPGGLNFTGFISNLRVIKGTALYTSNFTPPTAPLTNVTNTKLLCCQSTTSATAFDVSPGTITSVNAAATNFNPFTVNINTQRGQESGYATLNPLSNGGTLSNGNLSFANLNANNKAVYGTIGVSSGKWYFEAVLDNVGNKDCFIGIAKDSGVNTGNYVGSNANSWGYISTNGYKYTNASGSSYGASYTNGDVIGALLDLDNGTLVFYKNGISQGTAFSGLTAGTYFAATSCYNSSLVINFGQKPFKFPPPAGFQPLNASTARPSTIVARPDQYVGVTTYNGNGGTQQITYGFQPDLIFGKPRAATIGGGWNWVDSVRGNKYLMSQSTNGDADFTGGNGVSFNSTGIAVTDTTNGDWNLNGNYGGTYVGNGGYVYYGFKAGGNKNTFNVDDVGYATASAAGLDGGSATVTGASVGTKQGFSIIKYTTTSSAGDFTVSHGLSKAPKFIITRKISGGNWVTGHDSIGWTKYLFLNSAAGESTNANAWGNISPTSSVFGGNDASFYGNGVDQIAYIWHDVPGLQKFGSYTGNANADGPFVELGFRPALVIIKRTDATATNWMMRDSVRGPYNVINKTLAPNSSNSESTIGDVPIDFLSNGFKLRDNSSVQNASVTYIYAAWAESPSFNLYGAQSNAR